MNQQHKFLWGVATSAHQVEGGNHNNDWWEFECQGRVDGGVSSGRAVDHWNRFEEDFALARNLGLNAFRFSLEWSRIEPRENETDEAALSQYEAMIRCCKAQGMEPMVTLHHFTLPLWVAKKGGVTCPEFPQFFARFVERVITRFNDLGIRDWITINEPMVLACGSYLAQIMPPMQVSLPKVQIAAKNLLRGHHFAYGILHRLSKTPIRVGIAQNMVSFRPARAYNPLDWFICRKIENFYNWAWIDGAMGVSARFSIPGVLADPEPLPLMSQSLDFIGMNYYTTAWVKPQFGSEVPVAIEFSRPGDVTSDLGWSITPEGFEAMIKKSARYGIPLMVTENGIADRDDFLRMRFIKSHLDVLDRCVRAGIAIQGYFHWSLLDNFEWIKGFRPRFGLYSVNYQTLERTPRESATLYQHTIQSLREENPEFYS